MAETPVISSMLMDRSEPLGNSDDGTGRRALHIRDMSAFISVPHDSGSVSYPNSTTEIYQFKQGGLTGTVVATVTIVYTDATKNQIASWVRA